MIRTNKSSEDFCVFAAFYLYGLITVSVYFGAIRAVRLLAL